MTKIKKESKNSMLQWQIYFSEFDTTQLTAIVTLGLEELLTRGVFLKVEPLDEPEPRRTKKKTKSKKTL
jgi:hypothetical protein